MQQQTPDAHRPIADFLLNKTLLGAVVQCYFVVNLVRFQT